MAVAADLVLAVALTALLLRITSASLDAIPRPLALLALYATPGIVGAVGVRGHRRSLLFAAGIVLVPGSLLSFTGVTLIFALPLALFWAAAVTMGPPDPRPPRAGELAELIVAAGLMLGAGLALFATSWSGCTDTGSICGSGFLSWEGVVLELGLLLAAIAAAARRASQRPAPATNDGSHSGAPA
ncbi:MAG TPA: hypothetical protein VIU37_07945 [Candidatus Limnocylindrales bacterium]